MAWPISSGRTTSSFLLIMIIMAQTVPHGEVCPFASPLIDAARLSVSLSAVPYAASQRTGSADPVNPACLPERLQFFSPVAAVSASLPQPFPQKDPQPTGKPYRSYRINRKERPQNPDEAAPEPRAFRAKTAPRTPWVIPSVHNRMLKPCRPIYGSSRSKNQNVPYVPLSRSQPVH